MYVRRSNAESGARLVMTYFRQIARDGARADMSADDYWPSYQAEHGVKTDEDLQVNAGR